MPLVSVIICSRNSARTIEDCLMSILFQSYKPIEIIVVDDFSSDSTIEIAQEAGAFVISHRGERSVAKNMGAKMAKGDYIFFVDADHTLGLTSIAMCVASIDERDGVLITDQDVRYNSRISRLVASRRSILSFDPFSVAVRFIKKEVFLKLGGFDPELYVGEDLDFHRRFLLGGFRYAPSGAIEWHLGSPVSLRGLLNRSLYYSSNYLRYVSKNPLIALRRLNPLLTVTAWKKSIPRRSDLPSVVLLGFLSNAFLLIGLLLNFTYGQDNRRE